MKTFRSRKVASCAILVLTLLVTLSLAGCGAGQSVTETPPATSTPTPDNSTGGTVTAEPEQVVLPISKEGITLKMFCILDGKASLSLTSLEENAAMKKYEELSGVNIEWSHPSSASSLAESLNVMIASGDIPDIISNIMSASDSLDELIKKGVIMRLNELIDQYGYNLKKAFDENPEFYSQVRTYEGNIGLYPSSRLDEDTRYFESFIMREDWLKQFNLEAPKTVDEWYTVLKTFKTKDPNGNGIDDELPFVSNSNEEMGVSRLSSLWGINANFYKWNATTVLNDKVVFATNTDKFVDYVTAMNKWYQEGLIDPEYVSTDATGWKEKIMTNVGGSFYGKMNGGIATLMGSFDYAKDSDFSLMPVPYAITEDGKSYDMYSQDIFDAGGCAISATTKYPKEAVQWLDYLYSPEGQILASFGVEGLSYTKDSNGVPHYTDLITNNPDGLSMVNAIAKYSLGGMAPRLVNDKHYWTAVMKYDQQKMVYPTVSVSSTERKLPGSLKYSQKDFDRLTKLMADIGTYYKEGLNGFIMGTKPLSEMEAFKKELNSMGLDEAVSIMQKAYDLYIQ